MSLVTLFTQTKRNIGGIQIDAIINEVESNVVTVTSNPIETGASINDHAIVQPKLYRLEGVVSDTERGSIVTDNAIDNVINNVVSDIESNAFNPFPTSARGKEAYQQLIDLMERREPFVIITGLRQIKNVIITNITTSRDKLTSKGLFFTAELQQLLIVSNQQVTIKPENLRPGATREQATKEVNKGVIAAPTVDVSSTLNEVDTLKEVGLLG